MSDFKPRFLKPSDTSSFLDKGETTIVETSDFVYNKFLSQSIQTQRQRLPIFNNRNHILYLLEKYQTLILVGETGCGKSTQIPQVRLSFSLISILLAQTYMYPGFRFASTNQPTSVICNFVCFPFVYVSLEVSLYFCMYV